MTKLLRSHLFLYERDEAEHTRRRMAQALADCAHPEQTESLFAFTLVAAMLRSDDASSAASSAAVSSSPPPAPAVVDEVTNAATMLPGWRLHDPLYEIARLVRRRRRRRLLSDRRSNSLAVAGSRANDSVGVF